MFPRVGRRVHAEGGGGNRRRPSPAGLAGPEPFWEDTNVKTTLKALVASTAAVTTLAASRARPVAQRLPDHQDRHQPLLREDARRRRSQGRRTRHRAQVLRRQVDGDHETQVQAIETCIADGAKGILITASDTSSIVPAVQQARDAGAPRHRARHAARADRCRRRDLRHRQLPRRSPDRPVGAAKMGDEAAERADRHARPQPSASRRWTSCATRASCRASASTSPTRT
jgi:hypothetical protein